MNSKHATDHMKTERRRKRRNKERERQAQLRIFLETYQTMDLRGLGDTCVHAGMDRTSAETFAIDVVEIIDGYHAAMSLQAMKAEHDVIARRIFRKAGKALRLLHRKGHGNEKYRSLAESVHVDLLLLRSLKCTSSSPYVCPLMRYGFAGQSLRKALGRPPPPSIHGRCRRHNCPCRKWRAGLPDYFDVFEEFECPVPADVADLDPLSHTPSKAEAMLRLCHLCFKPGRWPHRPRRGPPEHAEDQDAIDLLCSAYERTGGQHASHDNTRWTAILENCLAMMGLDYLGTENRLKRFEKLRAEQRRRFGAIEHPRGMRINDKMPLKKQEKSIRGQYSLGFLAQELFMGGRGL